MNYVIGNGKQYIRIGKQGKPVTCNKERAEMFNYPKANNIISCLPKHLQNLGMKVIDTVEEEEQKEKSKIEFVKVMEVKNYEVSDNVSRWVVKAKEINGVTQEAKERGKELNKELSNVDKALCDLRHFMEENRLNACDGFKMYQKEHNLMRQRRAIKDEMAIVNNIARKMPQEDLASQIQSKVNNLTSRKYMARILA